MQTVQTTSALVNSVVNMAIQMVNEYHEKTGSSNNLVGVIAASVPEADQHRTIEYFAGRAEQMALGYRDEVAALVVVWNHGVVIACHALPNNLPGLTFDAPQDRTVLGKLISEKIHESFDKHQLNKKNKKKKNKAKKNM